MRLFVNPYTGAVLDFDAIDGVQVGVQRNGDAVVAKFCPTTGKPLNHAAVGAYSYPGPISDRELWEKDARETVARIAVDVESPSASTLGVTVPTAADHSAELAELRAKVDKLEAAAQPSGN
jgi:hypothetical protein